MPVCMHAAWEVLFHTHPAYTHVHTPEPIRTVNCGRECAQGELLLDGGGDSDFLQCQ